MLRHGVSLLSGRRGWFGRHHTIRHLPLIPSPSFGHSSAGGSAHPFFANQWYGFDDALYAATRILDILARRGESLAAFRDSLPPVVNTPEIRFPCPDTRKFKVPKEVKYRLMNADATIVDIDGVRVTTEDGWWLLRASNTQDALVARCEARDEAGLARLKAMLRDQLALSEVEVSVAL